MSRSSARFRKTKHKARSVASRAIGSSQRIRARLDRSCIEVCALLKAMAHPQRILILAHLLDGPQPVSYLVEELGISQSQISQFLSRMRLEGLVGCERRGRFVYYFLGDVRLNALIDLLSRDFCVGGPQAQSGR